MTPPNARNISRTEEKCPSLSVLIVDDEPLIRWSLKQGLAERGHHVATAATAAAALDEVRMHAFDVMILDYRLPDRQDLTLLEDMKRLAPQSAVLMMTAFGDDQMRSGAQARGALAVIDKPFQVRSLVDLVESSSGR